MAAQSMSFFSYALPMVATMSVFTTSPLPALAFFLLAFH